MLNTTCLSKGAQRRSGSPRPRWLYNLLAALRKLFAVAALFCAAVAEAQSSFVPGEGEMFLSTFGGKVFTCAFQETWMVGAVNSSTGIFTPTKLAIQKKKKKAKKQRGAALRKTKNNIARDKVYLSVGSKICQDGPEGAPPYEPPTPTATPSPSPTSNPNSCFESNGDTKPGCFGIPSGLTGNKIRGQTYYAAQCTGCHESKANKTYQQVDAAFTNNAPMEPFRPDNLQDLRDLVAYINRFSL